MGKTASLNELIQEYKAETDKSALNTSVFTIITALISYYKASVSLNFFENEKVRSDEISCAALGDREEELCTSLKRIIALQNLEESRYNFISAQTKLNEYFSKIPDLNELEIFLDAIVCDSQNAPSMVLAKNEAERAFVNEKILEQQMLFVHPKIFTSGSIKPPDPSSLSLSAGVRISLTYDASSVQRLKSSKDATLSAMFEVYSSRDAYDRDYRLLLLDLLYARAEKALYCGAFGNAVY